MKFINRTFLLVNFGVIVATLLAYLAPTIDPEFTWTISFFGLFYPILLVLNILFVLFWLFKKPKYALFSLFCILLGWNQVKGFINFNSPRPETSDETITVMTYNISNALHGYDAKKKNRAIKKKALVEFLDQFKDVDILCIQEVGDYAFEILKKTFPKHHYYRKNKGAIILSKYPFIKKGEIDFGTITNSCLWADIQLKHDIIRVYSFHLQSNQITKDAEKLASDKDLVQKEAWYDIKGILRKFKNRHIQRSRQAEKIVAHAEQTDNKLILAGDMNDSPQSYTYHTLSRLGKDAFRERGVGLGTTFGGVIPLLRIDYIFVDNALQVATFDVIRKDFSDHYPLISTIEWPEPTVDK
ncbi:MAG: endonuclease/exonuclease/phosphatase family protein [Saprospiraceae bacterium]|nr:endonuclease/exonuclease/phosphatase family protein [Saprospiraceae bacterium]MCZ2339532.1 endonuclease/exonuclease/phosphatase family protein [Chitinophagales bacterium]